MTKIHDTITLTRVMDACHRYDTTLDNPGFCLACGVEVEGVEPDASEYECEVCHERRVYGASEILIMGAYHTAIS